MTAVAAWAGDAAAPWWVLALLAAVGVLSWPARAEALLAPARPRRRRLGLQRSDPQRECAAALDAMVSVLRSGAPAVTAVDLAVAPLVERGGVTGPGWARLRDTAALDGDVPALWRELAHQWHLEALDDVAAAWQLSKRQGCPLADALAGAAASMRARRRHAAAIDAATAGAKATMGVLFLLPVLGIGLGASLGVDMLECYSGRSGFITLWPGLALLAAGSGWARRMVDGALRTPAGAS